MERFLSRSSSNPNLATKRPRDEGSADQWQQPKKFAVSAANAPKKKTSGSETNNRFSDLPVDDIASETFIKATKKKVINQIPPILVDLQGDWSHKSIKDTVEKYEKGFHLQYRGRNRVKIQCYTTQGHQQVKEGLLKENVYFHTFSRKDEKLPKVVIKGLPKFVHDTLAAELSSLGFAGVTVTDMKTLHHTECPPLLAQLPSGSDMGKFKQIKYISNCVVTIEKYKPNNKLGTQCFRCQGFGHASKNCNRPARCVKCALEHPTWECQKKGREEPARCCNCQQNHPANYGQCPERLKYLDRIQSKRENFRRTMVPTVVATSSSRNPSKSTWAQVTSKPKPQTIKQSNSMQTSSVSIQAERTKGTLVEVTHIHDLATAEMLEILNTIKTIKNEFTSCKTFMEKVTLILTHLGHYV